MKKIGILSLVVVFVLGSLGVGYATWKDDVQIEGTVEMGSLTLVFDPDEILGYVDNEPPWVIPPYPGKDIGWGEIYYDPASYEMDAHTGKDGYNTLIFVVHDAYPSYKIHFTTVTVHNIGTIPIHMTDIKVWDPIGELEWEWTEPPPTSPCYGVFWKDFDKDTVRDPLGAEDIMNVLVKNFVCEQLDPCESRKGEVDLHFKEAAEECHTYHFKIAIEGVQWNKFVP